jgi:hypothetical protein
MKYSVLACKDLTDVVRETAVLQEYNAKVRAVAISVQDPDPLRSVP